MAADIISYGYAAIVLAGGVVGYVKAGECCWKGASLVAMLH